jgi:hypothetical protein
MRIFATEIIEAVQGKQVFEKLLVDGVCLLDEFEKAIEDNPQYTSELKTLFAYMNLVADGLLLPKTKFREIKGDKINTKRYELKSKHLRIYLFNQPSGKMVVLVGYKNTQEADIRQFNSIVKEFTSTTLTRKQK